MGCYVLRTENAQRRRAQQLLFVVILGLLTSCDTSVDVVRSSEQFQYSLYGVLNVAADTQFIRVEPLGDTTQFSAPRHIEVDVYLENLDTETRFDGSGLRKYRVRKPPAERL